MKEKQPLHVVILAAGESRRFNSAKSKLMHLAGGRPILDYVLSNGLCLSPCHLTLVASKGLSTDRHFSHMMKQHSVVDVVLQETPKGTADAVMCGLSSPKVLEKKLLDCGTLILLGDSPLMPNETLKGLMRGVEEDPCDVMVVAMRPPDPQGYGRCLRDEKGRLVRIVEHKEASDSEAQETLCNSGIMWLGPRALPLIKSLPKGPITGEVYMTSLIEMAHNQGLCCRLQEVDTSYLLGINTRRDLATAENILQERFRDRALAAGATLRDPATIFLSFDTDIAADVIIDPFVRILPGVKLASGVRVGSFCCLQGVHVSSGSQIGPFVHLHDHVKVQEGAVIGNFVEVTRSSLGTAVKAKHLSYIGDSQIGEESNLGAGFVTCNFDGFKKHQTKIGKQAFIGSHVSLVAPLTLSDGTFVAAGSTITETVPKGHRAFARARQVNKPLNKKPGAKE